ncbi:unnamed protein product [Arabis nemorensis]|uniref:Short-chain dehydrogenase reductase 3b-like n=1 Tax=Arabis nemorensis TaxID=586526 RepID=A0A565ARW8_9BRAS|nr:unnamed protein product [Arabis nemorensis]
MGQIGWQNRNYNRRSERDRSGIGEAVHGTRRDGARVVIVDVQDELGQNVAETKVENAVNFTVKKHGKIDVLFSNAGVLEQQVSILNLNLDELDRVMAVNLRGSAVFIKHVAGAMVKSGTRGSIVCTTSVAAEIVGNTPHGYTASKHGLLGLVRSSAGELGKHGIRVNGVAPFGIATPLACDGYKMEASEMEEMFSLTANLKGVVLKARHVSEAALFLASDDSAYVSGHNLAVDGGYTVVKP